MNKLTTLSVLFSIMCLAALADDMPVEGQVVQSPDRPKKVEGDKLAQADEASDEGDLDEEIFTKEDFKREFMDDLTHETSRLQLRIGFPEWYALQGQSAYENYLASDDWGYTNDEVSDGFKDALKHAFVEAGKHTLLWLAIERWFEKIGAKPFAEQEKKFDFESSNEVRYGFLFGSEGSLFPDFGYELSDRPSALLEMYQRSGVSETNIDENGDEVEKPILIRHRLSYKVTDLLDPQGNGRARYEIDNIGGWFGLNLEHNLENQTTKLFFDGFEIAPDRFLYGGISYYGEENGFGFHDDQMVAPEDSVTFSVGMHGSVSGVNEIYKAILPWNWVNPFKRGQQAQKRHTQRQRHDELLIAAAR